MAVTLRYIADPTDLKLLLTEQQQAMITNDDAYGTIKDPDMVKQYIGFAEGVVDSKLGVRYGTPLVDDPDETPLALKWAILTIAKYQLFLRRNAVDDDTREGYNQAIAWLDAIRNEEADLFPPDPDLGGDEIWYGFVDQDETLFGGVFFI